jgi:hypothetical protein
MAVSTGSSTPTMASRLREGSRMDTILPAEQAGGSIHAVRCVGERGAGVQAVGRQVFAGTVTTAHSRSCRRIELPQTVLGVCFACSLSPVTRRCVQAVRISCSFLRAPLLLPAANQGDCAVARACRTQGVHISEIGTVSLFSRGKGEARRFAESNMAVLVNSTLLSPGCPIHPTGMQ